MNFLLSALIGLSAATWIYARIFRKRLIDVKISLISSAIIGVVLTFMLWMIANALIPE